jgi:hypothetical protein
MSIEAMKRALKTFEKIHEGCGFVKEDDLHKDAKDLATYVQEDCDFTMRTLRQAIEQAEKQEPVAWMEDSIEFYAKDHPTNSCTIPLYTAPPKREWIGLTDEEIAQTVGSPIDEVYLADFHRVIEKLRSKNT